MCSCNAASHFHPSYSTDYAEATKRLLEGRVYRPNGSSSPELRPNGAGTRDGLAPQYIRYPVRCHSSRCWYSTMSRRTPRTPSARASAAGENLCSSPTTRGLPQHRRPDRRTPPRGAPRASCPSVCSRRPSRCPNDTALGLAPVQPHARGWASLAHTVARPARSRSVEAPVSATYGSTPALSVVRPRFPKPRALVRFRPGASC